jgi:bacterioferritin
MVFHGFFGGKDPFVLHYGVLPFLPVWHGYFMYEPSLVTRIQINQISIDILLSIQDTVKTMGTLGRKIVDTDVDELVKLLNKAFSDEWLAYYQYWVGSKIVRGPNKEAVIAELTLHATEELGHAVLLTTRIIQLGGTPVTSPQQWFKLTNCGYEAPDDPFIVKVLEQNIKGEQCAIKTYNSLLKKTRDKDPVTYNILLGILQMEVEHEEDLQALLEDVNIIMKNK